MTDFRGPNSRSSQSALDPRELPSVLRALVAVAWADGKMDLREQEFLNNLLARHAMDEPARLELLAFASTPRTLDDLDPESLSDVARRHVLDQAALLAQIDGEEHSDEQQVLEELARRLNLLPELMESIARARRLRQMML